MYKIKELERIKKEKEKWNEDVDRKIAVNPERFPPIIITSYILKNQLQYHTL